VDPVTVRVCFVCLGNICRSPTAEAVMAHLVAEAGLDHAIELDSAGTGGWHVGDPPDDRATAEAARRGIAMRSRARQFHVGDFAFFDLVVAMDGRNVADLHDLALDQAHRDKVVLLRSFDPNRADGIGDAGDLDVPDPYYGGPDGFARVFDLVEAACVGLLDHLASEHLASEHLQPEHEHPQPEHEHPVQKHPGDRETDPDADAPAAPGGTGPASTDSPDG
jgi:protein-tyrosine phosphatase